MSFDGTSVTYSTSASDWGAAMVALRRRSRGRVLLWLLPLGFGVLGIVDLAIGDVTGLGLIAGAILIAGLGYSAWLNGQLVKRPLGRLIGQATRLTLTDAGLEFSKGPSSGALTWSGVDDVIATPRVVIVTRDRAVSWAIIPRSAFASEHELDAFRDAITEGRARSRATQTSQ